MRMVSFRIDNDKYRDLTDYATDRGVTVSEVLNRLVDSLILGESRIDLNGSNVMALKGRVERLEELLTGKGDNPGDGKSPDTRKEEEISKEEVAEVVAEIMGGREKDLVQGIAEDVAERIEKGEAETTERIGELFGFMDRFTTELEQLNASQTKLAETVVFLKEQVKKCKVHTTAEEMISCPECGPFFLDSVRIARDKLAEARALEEEKLPRAWLIMALGGGHRGFKWDEELEYYCRLTADKRLADGWSKKRDIKVRELVGIELEQYKKAHPPRS